jgi:ribosomal protein S1
VNSFFKIGEEIEVKVKSLDQEKRRVALSYKQESENPWLIFSAEFKEGDVVETKVVAMKNFGIFVGIVPGVDGLIHVSELSENFTSRPPQVFKIGDPIKAKILEIDNEHQRVKMSIRAIQEEIPIDLGEIPSGVVPVNNCKDPESPNEESQRQHAGVTEGTEGAETAEEELGAPEGTQGATE